MESSGVIKLALGGVAAWLIYEWFAGQTTTTGAVAPASSTPASSSSTSNGQLSSTFAALNKAASVEQLTNGQLLLNGDQWNYYLMQVIPGLTPPDAVALFGARPQTPFTAAVYWTAVAPWLTTNKGMSGVDVMLAGLGRYIMANGRTAQW